MGKEIRVIFLGNILEMQGIVPGKYTGSFNNLKAVIELERKDSKEKLPQRYFDRFDKIEKDLNSIDERVKGFPLMVVEQYFFRNRTDLDKYIYMSHNNVETITDFKVLELYEMLENFFSRVYMLAVEISDYYSLDIKMKKSGYSDGESEDIL